MRPSFMIVMVFATYFVKATAMCNCTAFLFCRSIVETTYEQSLMNLGFTFNQLFDNKAFDKRVEQCMVSKGYRKDMCGIDLIIPISLTRHRRRRQSFQQSTQSSTALELLARSYHDVKEACKDFTCPGNEERHQLALTHTTSQQVSQFEKDYQQCFTRAQQTNNQNETSHGSNTSPPFNVEWW